MNIRNWFKRICDKIWKKEPTVDSLDELQKIIETSAGVPESPAIDIIKDHRLSPADVSPIEVEEFVPLDAPNIPPKEVVCPHSYILEKQIWTRVAPRRYELQNGYVCEDCGHTKVEPIR